MSRARTRDATQADAAENRARVVALRRRRLTFEEIGEQLGFSAQRAHQVYTDALKAIPAMEVEQHRTEELTLIDDAIAKLLPIAENATQPRTAVEAWNSIRGWAERKARLLGLDAAVKIDARMTEANLAEFDEAIGQFAGLAVQKEQQDAAKARG